MRAPVARRRRLHATRRAVWTRQLTRALDSRLASSVPPAMSRPSIDGAGSEPAPFVRAAPSAQRRTEGARRRRRPGDPRGAARAPPGCLWLPEAPPRHGIQHGAFNNPWIFAPQAGSSRLNTRCVAPQASVRAASPPAALRRRLPRTSSPTVLCAAGFIEHGASHSRVSRVSRQSVRASRSPCAHGMCVGRSCSQMHARVSRAGLADGRSLQHLTS